MRLWKLTPVADRDDPRWLDFRRYSEVLVRAETSAEARLVALERLGPRDTEAVGNESGHREGGFLDEKLYRVAPAGAAPDGDRATSAEVVSWQE